MLRQVVVGVIVTGLAVGLVWEQPAQSADSCREALAEAQYQIERKNTEVVRFAVRDMSRESGYDDYPEGYPMAVNFTITGPGSESVMNSGVFLKALSHNIIMKCGPVSVVGFGVDQTD